MWPVGMLVGWACIRTWFLQFWFAFHFTFVFSCALIFFAVDNQSR